MINDIFPAKPVVEATVDYVTITISDTEIYRGYPADKTVACTDSKWKVVRFKEITVSGAKVMLSSTAGTGSYQYVFNPAALAAIQALPFTTYSIAGI
jgi:hypothetical protein